jgi:hypothetical protein
MAEVPFRRRPHRHGVLAGTSRSPKPMRMLVKPAPQLCKLRRAAILDSDPTDFMIDPPLRVRARPDLVIDSLDKARRSFARTTPNGDPGHAGGALPVGKSLKSGRSQERRRWVPMVARGEPSNGDTRTLRLIGNSPAKRDIADRVDFRVCPGPSPLPQGAQSQVRPSGLVELRSQPGAQPVAKREENS